MIWFKDSYWSKKTLPGVFNNHSETNGSISVINSGFLVFLWFGDLICYHFLLILVGNDDQKLPRDCKLKVEADRKGDGLMVHLHNSYLRRRNQTDECIDSVAFGEDDLVPFLTIKKSGPLCGPQPDWSYDITNGKLIFWLHLSHLRPEKHRQRINYPFTRESFNTYVFPRNH